MDWFSWLSKTGLEACLVYEYGVVFSQNELEEDDIAYFNHEFLQSMGISIAKHRLEILKLARKEKVGGSRPRPTMSRLLVAIKTSKRSLVKYLRTWIHNHREESPSSALVVVPRPTPVAAGYGSRWRGAMLKRNKKLMMSNHYSNQPRLLLTNSTIPGPLRIESFSSPVVCDYQKDEAKIDGDVDVDGYWSTGVEVEEIRWDTMFQDLKPT
ncbi:hypothetical protein ACOSQ2_021319 [Xanthoceras sorbifolium]|uniref:SAM domain-containing protein n=1 Tax=Xanthoceras sorbifolium TaxID=99658 RepID=A0ABQ8HL39_9ROSI|nr:hypothetical protein JRO89_XS09G0098100 [Xanthoceras sorbifolium]